MSVEENACCQREASDELVAARMTRRSRTEIKSQGILVAQFRSPHEPPLHYASRAYSLISL